MTITINSQKALLVLLGALALFYTTNIYTTRQLSAALIDEPTKLSFVAIAAPDQDCTECVDPNEVVKVIDSAHNIAYDTSVVAYDDPLARKYIDMYEIKNLPALIVSGDTADERMLGSWKSLGGRVQDDRVVIENLLPFYDLETGSVRGVTKVILLKDETCTACFDENAYLNILQRFGVTVGETDTYDVASAEGQSLVTQYNIKKVPTMLASPDISAYNTVMSSWNQVGTVEDDGWIVLREVQKISTEFKSL